MIKKRTVFILGAGASFPYGFPTGDGLRQLVLGSTPGSAADYLAAMGITHAQVEAFKSELAASYRTSVDQFLEYRPEHLQLGKVLIAYNLILREELCNLSNPPHPGSWYSYLFNELMYTPYGFEGIATNNVTFLTYNYDRSFEQALLSHLMHAYGKTEGECLPILSRIQVIHLHGSLGPLFPSPIVRPGEERVSRPYMNSVTPGNLKIATDHLKIIHEHNFDEPHFGTARDILRDAEHMFFLGFGYNPVNIQRLGFQDVTYASHIYGTAWNLESGEVQLIGKRLNHKATLINDPIITFLRKFASTISD